eukprot:Transcript_10813.p2 GENE.Transcript_10813~~Transcript_10813.p2  ORF type:complete len:445 (+),score=68.26 Transcript_10813:126-1337(+)
MPISPWLAMGMIVGRLQPPFRRQTVGSQWVIWRYVTTQAEHAADPRYVVVQGCPDFVFATNRTRIEKTEPGFQFSCFCKTAAWFERAVALFPRVRFIGKMEDDSVLYDTRVVAELAAAHRVARREQGVRGPLLWYGHFDWSAHRMGVRGMHCGIGDSLMLRSTPACGRGFGVTAPYASGGLDIRSRALAERMGRCDELRRYLRGYAAGALSLNYSYSCDGIQGFWIARCLAPALREAGEVSSGRGHQREEYEVSRRASLTVSRGRELEPRRAAPRPRLRRACAHRVPSVVRARAPARPRTRRRAPRRRCTFRGPSFTCRRAPPARACTPRSCTRRSGAAAGEAPEAPEARAAPPPPPPRATARRATRRRRRGSGTRGARCCPLPSGCGWSSATPRRTRAESAG